MSAATYAEVSWERMSNAVENVRRRLLRSTSILSRAKIPYAVADDHAVAAWVSRVDEAAVRNTQDVDIVLRRADLPAARQALERAGFVYRHAASMDMFLDGPDAKARDAVHIVFAAEKVRADYASAVPINKAGLFECRARGGKIGAAQNDVHILRVANCRLVHARNPRGDGMVISNGVRNFCAGQK